VTPIRETKIKVRGREPLRNSGGPFVRVDLQNLGLEFRGAKRLVDKTGNACVSGLYDLLYRWVGSHEDEGQIRELFV
jgi:hypothetical protein